jgi:hypothetical protein
MDLKEITRLSRLYTFIECYDDTLTLKDNVVACFKPGTTSQQSSKYEVPLLKNLGIHELHDPFTQINRFYLEVQQIKPATKCSAYSSEPVTGTL